MNISKQGLISATVRCGIVVGVLFAAGLCGFAFGFLLSVYRVSAQSNEGAAKPSAKSGTALYYAMPVEEKPASFGAEGKVDEKLGNVYTVDI